MNRCIPYEPYYGTLKDLFDQYSGPTVISSIDLLRQMAKGLDFLHSKKILCFNLKHKNVVICTSENGCCNLKLTNWCLVRRTGLVHLNQEIHGNINFESNLIDMVSSPSWLPSEAWNTRSYTYAMDVFALGCLFGFTLNKGIHPFGHVKTERITRIRNGQPMIMLARDLVYINGAIAVYHLIKRMVSAKEHQRPKVSEVLNHYCFNQRQYKYSEAKDFDYDSDDTMPLPSRASSPIEMVDAVAGFR